MAGSIRTAKFLSQKSWKAALLCTPLMEPGTEEERFSPTLPPGEQLASGRQDLAPQVCQKAPMVPSRSGSVRQTQPLAEEE